MRIVNRCVVCRDEAWRLKFLGVKIDAFNPLFDESTRTYEFRVAEDHPLFARVTRWAEKLRVSILVETEYSELDLLSSRYVNVLSSYFSGYPEPCGSRSEWINASFDVGSHCNACGAGRHQVAPIRAKYPKPLTGKMQTWQMHWLTDVLFVGRDLYETVFEPLGVGCWPVLAVSGKSSIDGIVQLKPQSLCDVWVPDYVASSVCPVCNIRKHLPYYQGFMPTVGPCTDDFVASSQYFGDGGEAQRWLYISQRLYRKLAESSINLRFFATSE